MAFDSHGRIVGLCGGLEGFELMVIDPVTLQPIAELHDLAARPAPPARTRSPTSAAAPTSTSTSDDRAYPTTVDKQIWKVAVGADGSLAKEQPGRSPASSRGRLPDRDHARLEGPDLVLHPAGRGRHHRPRHRRGAHDPPARGRARSSTRCPPTRPAACTSSPPRALPARRAPQGRRGHPAGDLARGLRPRQPHEAGQALAGLGHHARP